MSATSETLHTIKKEKGQFKVEEPPLLFVSYGACLPVCLVHRIGMTFPTSTPFLLLLVRKGARGTRGMLHHQTQGREPARRNGQRTLTRLVRILDREAIATTQHSLAPCVPTQSSVRQKGTSAGKDEDRGETDVSTRRQCDPIDAFESKNERGQSW